LSFLGAGRAEARPADRDRTHEGPDEFPEGNGEDGSPWNFE
jgi:hypothetical protein